MKWSTSAIAPWLAFILLHASDIPQIEAGWIDEDTPEDKRVTTSLIDGTEYQLVSF